MDIAVDSIDAAVAQLRRGAVILVADDTRRENEVDAIIAATTATPATVGWMIRHTSGFLCAPMTAERADRLGLAPMTDRNEDPHRTAYTVTVDARDVVSTGISATDRALTLAALAHPATTPSDLLRPGHIVPLRARPGGTAERGGHTEATVDLLALAGLPPVGALGELVHDDGEMVRLHEVRGAERFAGLPLISVDQVRDARWGTRPERPDVALLR
ncbi:3,4-dihydroxy-2-butanone-4-phosphate synthase [Tsukamurella strandjordii]|uniref:3,4-dihydroxy-2-butanone-4-phosphate synthase n=1 Tax=Tsukamurella TaxID=2060 RepID=UPI002086D0F3|nr:3,4-dihydroxy-2-butanone-4-phosphate synthase [Tsukamurella sp. TY48]GIZ99343.1 hypothetical protein TTY48_39550 [Tsukamurella sp. TY48]